MSENFAQPNRDRLRQLVEAATLAPSGDNTQPCRFQIDAKEGRILVAVDPTRDPSPMNAGQRMARIAVGAAVENIVRTVTHNGGQATVVPNPESTDSVTIQVEGIRGDSLVIEDVLKNRVTNRKRYDGRRAAPELIAELTRETPEIGGVRTHWIADTPRVQELARLIGRADALMFGERSMRRAFLENIRFDAPPDERVTEGLPLASLEMPSRDIAAFRALAPLPDGLLTILGFGRKIAKASRRLVESAAGLCVGVAPDNSPAADFLVGRAMQRAWLALAQRDLAVQPMMSLPVLDNALQYGSESLKRSLAPGRIGELMGRLGDSVPATREVRAAFLLRFGVAPPPTGRTGRLPLDRVVSAS